jgi:hypothetical protein
MKIVSVTESFLLTRITLEISKMVIIAWLILATLMLVGLISLSVMSIGIFVSLIVNLALLPLRIFIWALRLFFGIF